MEKRQSPRFNLAGLLGAVIIAVFLWQLIEGGMDQNPWRLLPPFLAVVLLVVAAAVLRARRRIKTLQRVSGELGFAFHTKGDEDSMRAMFDPVDEKIEPSRRGLAQSELRRLTLFRGVDHPRSYNVMAGRLGDADAVVFDYTYYTRRIDPGSSTSVSQTVAAFRFRGRTFPVFELSPESILKSGGDDLDFASHPVFSKRFHLRGDDENAVRTLFDVRTLAFFENLASDFDQTVEAAGDCIIVYRSGRLIRPEAIKAFVGHAAAVATAFSSSKR